MSAITDAGNELRTLFSENNGDTRISAAQIKAINLSLKTNLTNFKDQLDYIDDKYKPTFDFVIKMSYKGTSIQDCLNVINQDLDILSSFETSLTNLLQTYQNDDAIQTANLYHQAQSDFANAKNSFQLEKPFSEMLNILIEFPN